MVFCLSFYDDDDENERRKKEAQAKRKKLGNFLLLSNSYDKILSKCEEEKAHKWVDAACFAYVRAYDEIRS